MENVERNLESRDSPLREYALFGMEMKEPKVKAELSVWDLRH